MNVHSSHAAGRAAYTGQTSSSQDGTEAQRTSDSDAASSAQDAAATDAVEKSSSAALTSQEQQMIEERFPEDPELSMRLYGRGQRTKTVNPDAVGQNLDVTG